MKSQDWRLAPLAAAAWGGAWLGSAGLRPGWGPLLAVCAALLVIGIGALAGNRTWLVLVVVVLVVTTLLTVLRVVTIQFAAPAELAAEGAAATVVVKMVGEPRLKSERKPPLAIARAELHEVRARGIVITTVQPVVVFASGDVAADFAHAVPGATYEVRGRLASAERDSPEALVVRARSLSGVVAPPGAVDVLVNALRAGLRASTAHSPPQQAALVSSLVVGDTARITEEMDEQFKVTSLSHLMAVSGSNLSLMLVVLLALTRAVGVRGWWVRVVAMGGVALFVLVCRGEPSVVRAAAMGLVAVSATGVGRGSRTVRNLSLAVLCLVLLDPWLSRSWGFALSVAACSGIALWSPAWMEALAGWAPRWVAEALAIPLAAQLATQPLITALSGRVSVIGVLANALAGPFVGPATVLGLAAMCTAFLPGLPLLLGWVAGWCVQPIIWVAQFGSALPSAAWEWPASMLGVGLSALTCLVLGSVMVHALRRRLLTVALVVALIAGSCVRPVVWGWPGEWQAVFCDVGQGDATVLRAGPRAAVLVDTGPDATAVLACLDGLGIQDIPLLVLTHFHADHIGGLDGVVERFRPDVVLVSPFSSPPPGAAAVRRAADSVDAELVIVGAGEVFKVGDVVWTTISALDRRVPAAGVEGQSGAENDSSVVGIAQVGELRVLLPGDVEPSGQRTALTASGRSGIGLQAHVLKLPHHGSARQEPLFFAASGATLAVASAGEDNDYGHPARAALDLAVRDGMSVARTDLDGSIAVSINDGQLTVRTTAG
ncbi:MAG: ComEC/Rec2 family competence protein [Propionibacteriaceae bacterium]|nr:ComEC/Rec2 family competence protein [Propionibacteriaceae bacterium]